MQTLMPVLPNSQLAPAVGGIGGIPMHMLIVVHHYRYFTMITFYVPPPKLLLNLSEECTCCIIHFINTPVDCEACDKWLSRVTLIANVRMTEDAYAHPTTKK